MKLSTVREDVTAIVAAALPNDVGVIDHLPDQVAVPCVLVAWSDPWLTRMGFCSYTAALELICVAQRLEPGGHIETLEEIVSAILDALKGNEYRIVDATSPYPLEIAGVSYLAASINLQTEME